MEIPGRRLLGVLALVVPALAAAEEPAVKESVGVSLVQVEVTVWPRDPASDACLGLGKEAFALEVAGKPRDIYAVDAVGAEEEVYTVAGPRPEDAPAPGGMSVVLLFDLWHLDLFADDYPDCPRGKALAFREARRYVAEEFRDGDRLLLVTFSGWPVVHEGWIKTREEGLRALTRLENDRRVRVPRQTHSGHQGWIAGMESLYLALGRYPGRKDVIYLGEDFRFDDVALRMFEIAGRAQANGVVVSAMDLLDSCRRVQGAPCTQVTGGLGCSPWSSPVALNPIARDTGGSFYRNEKIGSALAALRASRKCRYLVSFTGAQGQRKRDQRITLRLRGDRSDLSLSAPSAYEPPERAPTAAERDEAMFLLPRFGRGLSAEAAIWPYRAAAGKGKKERWDVLALARLEHTEQDPWPEELSEITVHVLLRTDSRVHGSYTKHLGGEELAALRAPGGTRLLLFPIADVPPGETTLDLTLTSNVGGIAANLRKVLGIPKLPRLGEAGPWFLADHLVRLGDAAVMAPSLDGSVTPGEPAGLLGFGCRRGTGVPSSFDGRLVPSYGGPAVPVSVGWLRPGDSGACGWLFGAISAALPPGPWTFEPPAALAPKSKGGAPLEFTVEGGPGEAASH